MNSAPSHVFTIDDDGDEGGDHKGSAVMAGNGLSQVDGGEAYGYGQRYIESLEAGLGVGHPEPFMSRRGEIDDQEESLSLVAK